MAAVQIGALAPGPDHHQKQYPPLTKSTKTENFPNIPPSIVRHMNGKIIIV
jgi:hypothetical protein